jgi:molybdopterin synthase sulfur carrier subunit
MKILLFGALTDITGKSVIEMEPVNDLETLRRNLFAKFPMLRNYNFLVAVNKEKIGNNIILNPDDEIALLPPFAGG